MNDNTNNQNPIRTNLTSNNNNNNDDDNQDLSIETSMKTETKENNNNEINHPQVGNNDNIDDKNIIDILSDSDHNDDDDVDNDNDEHCTSSSIKNQNVSVENVIKKMKDDDNNGDDDDSDSDIEFIGTVQTKPKQQQQQQQQQQQNNNTKVTTASTNVNINHYHQFQQQYLYHQHQQQYQQHQPLQRNEKIWFEVNQYQFDYHVPYFLNDDFLPNGFTQTWEHILPHQPLAQQQRQQFTSSLASSSSSSLTSKSSIRSYKLSLCSQNEFILTAVPHHSHSWNYVPTLQGLRKTIKDITKHWCSDGEKAIYEPPDHSNNNMNENSGEMTYSSGRWRIPLSAYTPLLTYLNSDPMVIVERIPAYQLKIASIGRSMSERGHPSIEQIMEWGVPKQLAHSLAPFQRGGVDFVIQKRGRALIADDMGLGKTIQSIASMSCFRDEWPLLVLTPSSARYHWESELLNWLGDENMYENVAKGSILPLKRKSSESVRTNNDLPLYRNQINVLSSSKDIIVSAQTRVVICSYGLISNLISTGAIEVGQFQCVIVDESHMLKNNYTKRTKSLLPILRAAKRVIMLSGTPALARPMELFPQLSALDTENGYWRDENAFIKQYGRKENAEANFAELHTLLTSTLMIRRVKHDVLKSLPGKMREDVHVSVRCNKLKSDIMRCMERLRQGKGALGKLSLQHHMTSSDFEEKKSEVGAYSSLQESNQDLVDNEGQKVSRKALLSHLYGISGTSKIPIIVEMLNHFLADTRNGKICIFGHHLNVLDAIITGAELNNCNESNKKYIRIDGATNPKTRQEEINRFQRDPSVRVAILSITAAGVGVSLTAASTIWFAELTWTPAIMIQAEDRLVLYYDFYSVSLFLSSHSNFANLHPLRCHRIGQQSKVRCLYIIAKGTLDEVLFLLLQKKFRDLGEFVEGKEKMNIVMNRSYNDEKQAIESLCLSNSPNDINISNYVESDDQVSKNLAYEDSIRNEIEELAQEEQQAFQNFEQDDDDVIEILPAAKNVDDNNLRNKSHDNSLKKVGESEQHAICLLDEDDEDDSNIQPPECIKELLTYYSVNKDLQIRLQPNTKLTQTKFYYMYFNSTTYGFSVLGFEGRLVIIKNENVLCDVMTGDFIIGVNDANNFGWNKHNYLLDTMKRAKQTPPTKLTICRNTDFMHLFNEHLIRSKMNSSK